MTPDISVIIPTCGRPEKIGACVRSLTRQTLARERFEVLVGLDGPDSAGAHAVQLAWLGEAEDRLRLVECKRSGQASVRNRLLPLARGRTLVFLNDDMLPAATHLEAHLEAQREAEEENARALVIGASPWVVREPDRLFDRLVRETSMIFFYDVMDRLLAEGAADQTHDWGFRHAWLLNLSAPAELVRRAGGFTVFPETYGFEDDELAFRLAQRHGTRVLYRPGAVARHDHRYEPEAYLARERKLGRAAWGFARATPACARAMFGRDVTSASELAYSREFVERERAGVERARTSFRRLGRMPASAVDGPHADDLIAMLYQQHLPLKRWEWRTGLLEAADAEAATRAEGAQRRAIPA